MSKSLKILIFPLLLVFYEICTYLSNDMYLPALPTMMQDLQLSMSSAQLTLTSWFIGAAFMPLIMGIISDRFGRRPVLLVGGIVYILATILCALTNNFSLFLLGRIIEGAMVASMMVPGYACIHEQYDQIKAIKILALMGSVSILAPAFGPLLGGIVLYVGNWRSIFWLIALTTALVIAMLYHFMPETLPPEKRSTLRLKTLLLSYKNIVMNKRYMCLMAVQGFLFSGFIVWISAGPLLVIDSFHQTAIFFGWVQAFIFAANIIGNRAVKHLLNYFTVSKLIKIGISLTFLGGVLCFLFAAIFKTSLFAFVLGMSIYSFGSALSYSSLNRCIIESSDEPMGQRMAVFSTSLCTFAALGSIGASLFFNGTIFSLASLIMVSILISALLMRKVISTI